MSETLKKYFYFIFLGCIFLLGIALRLKLLLVNPSFWDDECSIAWNVVHKNYSDFFGVLEFTQVAPPFFMITAKIFTKIFGVSDFVLRLAPFLFSILAMGIFYFISEKLFKNKLTVIVSNFIFAINQPLVNYASEFKQYSCDVFFTLLCFYLFLDLLLSKATIKKYILYSFLFIISVWFSFVSAFVVGAGFLVLLLKQIKEKEFRIKEFLILVLPFLINGLFYLKFYIFKTFSANITELNYYWLNSYIAKDFSNFLPLVRNNISYFLFPYSMILPAFIAIITGAIILLNKNRYPALILILTIFIECFASWLGYYPFEKRVILFLLPIVLLFIVSIFEVFDLKNKLKSCFIVFLFLIIYIQPLLYIPKYISTKNINRGYFGREMMALMSEKIMPGDVIIVNKYSRTDFAYYSDFYKIKNQVIVEGQQAKRQEFLNSLPKGKYYWFYLPFGEDSPTFNTWMHSKRILLEVKGHPHSKLVYLYKDL